MATQTHPFTRFLSGSGMKPVALDRILDSKWTCQALFRSLGGFAQQVVLKLTFIDSVKLIDLQEGLSFDQFRPIIDQMMRIRMLELVPEQAATVRLQPTFRRHMAESLAGSEPESTETSKIESKSIELPSPSWNPPPEEVLRDWGTNRWESLVHYLVGSDGVKKPSKGLIALFVRTGLLRLQNYVHSDGQETSITSKGFQFLLQDTPTQQWSLLIEYLKSILNLVDGEREREKGSVEGEGANANAGIDSLRDAIDFIFRLVLMPVRKIMSEDDDDETETGAENEKNKNKSEIFKLCRDMGLLYPCETDQRSRPAFTATTLASQLTLDLDVSSLPDIGYLIVESNNKIYAYTTSTLQFAVLSLFTKLQYRLPNLIVGILTRESVSNAINNGITARQIVMFLESRAHSESGRDGRRPVPGAICDQIYLWEAELSRVSIHKVAIVDFGASDESLFTESLEFAERRGALLWSGTPSTAGLSALTQSQASSRAASANRNNGPKVLVVKREFRQDMLEFIESRTQS